MSTNQKMILLIQVTCTIVPVGHFYQKAQTIEKWAMWQRLKKLSRLAWGGSSKVHLSVSIKNTPQKLFGSFIVWTQLRFWLQFLSKTNLITNRYFLKTLCYSGAVSTEKNFICLSWRRQSWRCLDFCWEWPGGTGSEMNITEDVESQGWGHVDMCRGGLEDILDKGC